MSSPAPRPLDPVQAVTVEPEALDALGAELTALAADLVEDADVSRIAAADLRLALAGPEGWSAGAAATAWGSLLDLLARQAGGLALRLSAAAAAYRAQDSATAARIGAGQTPAPR